MEKTAFMIAVIIIISAIIMGDHELVNEVRTKRGEIIYIGGDEYVCKPTEKQRKIDEYKKKIEEVEKGVEEK